MDDPFYLLMQEQITLIALLVPMGAALVVLAGVVVGAVLVVQAGVLVRAVLVVGVGTVLLVVVAGAGLLEVVG